MPEIQSVPPKYRQIADEMRDQILRGDLRPGDAVPSERRLVSLWGVSRATATKALEALRLEGLVESVQGSGTRVKAQDAAPRARERYRRAATDGTMYSEADHVVFDVPEVVEAPVHVAEALRLSKGSPVIKRRRTITNDAVGSVELSVSWFDARLGDIAPRLLEAERIQGGTADYVGSITKVVPARCTDRVAARLGTSEELRLLGLQAPAAVLICCSTVFDENDVPIQYDDAIYPPDLWAFAQTYAIGR
ncbi:MAG: GntR family transcriptional regulator [Corynebacteriales bacterium]|nr:GntR family transcriptional regulator [Mycobacteriales bacterium]